MYKRYIAKSIIVFAVSFFITIENYAFSSNDKPTYTSTHGTSGGSCTVNQGNSKSSGSTYTSSHGTSGGSCTVLSSS